MAAVPDWDRRFVVPADERHLARVRRVLADLLFPPTCSGCDERGVWLCAVCWSRLPELAAMPDTCKRCGVPVVSGRCDCASLHPRVSLAKSAFPYAGWIAAAVHGIKYEGERDRARFLGAVLAVCRTGEVLRHADAVVPVPMFRKRERERGYNQVALMAAHACGVLGVRDPVPLLVQHEERPSQVGLNARQRRNNLRGAFSLDTTCTVKPGSRIVLVDDVRTTGATLLACVETLRAARPRRIDVVTLAAELSDDAMERVEQFDESATLLENPAP